MTKLHHQDVWSVLGIGGVPGECFVYLALARCGESVLAKIGISQNPIERLQEIAVGAPFEPESFAVVRLQSRKLAKSLEFDLLSECLKWRSRGEWLCMAPTDAAEFRAVCKTVMQRHSRGGIVLRWQPLPLDSIRKPTVRRHQPRIPSSLKVIRRAMDAR